jgi:hypothetical protein
LDPTLSKRLQQPFITFKILDQKDRVMRHEMIKFFKVQCVIVRYSCRAATPSKSRVEIFVRGEGYETPGVTVVATML